MTEAGIGRVLVASLHQGIADILPSRLEFYENWLNPEGLRHGTIGLAPLHAVLSFLRLEGDAYRQITERAGEYAAEWTVASQWPAYRSTVRALPGGMRVKAALRAARKMIRSSYIGSRAIVRMRRGEGTIDVRGSIFCGIREPSPAPLCEFYASAVARFLQLYNVPARVQLGQCRASGDTSCVLSVFLDGQPEEKAE